ncbi:hypothetical protein [Baekduia soli]|uniref:hypothetical protein n=1 Tax=Baekduia soli TaxID=496014 RepID=UPI001E5E6E4D|nr:hypothetical protein [Baekduia soli]
MSEQPARVLVLADRSAADPALLDAMRARAGRGPAQFRVVVPNPAPAEWHPMHPERRDKAAAAEQALNAALPDIEAAAGGPVIATVSIRHDPMDVVDAVMFHEPIDEIIVSQAPHPVERWFHVDLPHRLAHLKLPITVVDEAP